MADLEAEGLGPDEGGRLADVLQVREVVVVEGQEDLRGQAMFRFCAIVGTGGPGP